MKVAVIGVGSMGKNHARVFSEIANLVAVSDVNEDQGKAISKKFNCKYFKDYKDMVDSVELDAVSIAVPTTYHKDVALYCIEKGLHILLEKPIASNQEESMQIINAANQKNVKLLIGHIERFNPAVTALKKIMDQGELGEVLAFSGKRVGFFPTQIKDTNIIIDVAVHDVDIFNYLAGHGPKQGISQNGVAVKEHNCVDYATLLLDYGTIKASLEVNWITPIKIRRLEVIGTKGYAVLDYIKQELMLYKDVKELSEKKEIYNSYEWAKTIKENCVEINVINQEPLKLELQHFIDIINQDKQPLVSGEEGLAALKIVINALNIK